MRSLLHSLPLLVGVTLLGCGEEPSFRVRWVIDGWEAAKDPTLQPVAPSVFECSKVGVLSVRITTRDAFGIVVDSRTRSCASPELEDEGVAGPTLPPGPYAVEVRGVRRDGIGWTRPLMPLEELELEDNPDPGCVPALGVESAKQAPVCALGELACDCAFVEVAEGRTALLDGLAVDAPPQCEDGVDNDHDGLVDGFDPACRVRSDTYDREDAVVVANAQVVMHVSLLDHNPVVTCTGIGISRFVVSLDDDPPIAEPLCAEVLNRTFQFGAMVKASETHTVRVVAVDASGREVTVPKTFSIDIGEAGGGRFPIDVDFAAHEFAEPLVRSTTLYPVFSPYEGAGFTRDCGPDPTTGGGTLVLHEARMRLLGTHGQPLSPPAKLEDGVPLDGEAPLVLFRGFTEKGDPLCNFAFPTTPLHWGEYFLEVEALSEDGEICFSNVGEPASTAPGSSTIAVRRVFPIPASCRDCETTADCREVGAVCDDGVCLVTCTIDDDCPGRARCLDNFCVE